MAETSGFFEAVWDDSILNPETQELGDYDLKYLDTQFAEYFKLFVGNGVFVNPVNQLKVAASGNSVLVRSGFAFINGYWYKNDDDMILQVPANNTAFTRLDSVKIRFSKSDRAIRVGYFVNDQDIVRTGNIYDLKIANISVEPHSSVVIDSNITDERGNSDVCGFVKGLMQIVDTKDLFEQFTSIFNTWFDTVKDQVSGDLAIRLQMEFTDLNENVEKFHQESVEILNDSRELVQEFVYNDYVIGVTELNFIDKSCTIIDEKITEDALIDVYFTADTIIEAEDAQIFVDSVDGGIVLTALNEPEGTIKAMFRVRLL